MSGGSNSWDSHSHRTGRVLCSDKMKADPERSGWHTCRSQVTAEGETRGLVSVHLRSIHWYFLSAQHTVGMSPRKNRSLPSLTPPPLRAGPHRSPSSFTELKARGQLPSSMTHQRPPGLSAWPTASLLFLTDEVLAQPSDTEKAIHHSPSILESKTTRAG